MNILTPEEQRVIERKGTEAPFTGEYDDFYVPGTFICRKCNNPLFSSKAKFDAGCGWPAFDDHFPGAVTRLPDADGRRVEIECANCNGHLGHVFEGEGHTTKNTRHCVNSVSVKFVPEGEALPEVFHDEKNNMEIATLAGGCFWCTEAIFKRLKGVISVLPGYAGGHTENPTYEEVTSGTTGHAEAIQIEFDPKLIPYETILEVFWHTHDPTTVNRQGNDVGPQYRSVIFYHDEKQRAIAEESKKKIEESKIYPSPIVTEILPFTNFFVAEDYHKNYFDRNRNQGYCNFVIDPKITKLLKDYSTLVKDEYRGA